MAAWTERGVQHIRAFVYSSSLFMVIKISFEHKVNKVRYGVIFIKKSN